jgi:hypothetical protein
MDIEHCDCLSWFLRKGESHEQDGERLICAQPRSLSASSDPAMAFEPSMEWTGIIARLESAAASLPDAQRTNPVSASKRANAQRRMPSRSINDL